MTQDMLLSDLNFERLRTIIHEQTAISIGDGRKSLLLSRLRKRLNDTGVPDFKTYIARLGSDPAEMQEMIDRVTTNKTCFYRTPRIWDHFRTTAVADFVARDAGRPMRVWSAAASTGEEAHTAGILLEDMRQQGGGFDYRILGTDISARVIKQAEAGVFGPATLSHFRKERADLLAAHMMGDDVGGYRVSPQIRSRITFRQHNLKTRMTKATGFDVIFLRNVLIYFAPEDQERILAHVHALLHPQGTLYIGESESLTRLSTGFAIVEPMIYRPAGPGAEPVG